MMKRDAERVIIKAMQQLTTLNSILIDADEAKIKKLQLENRRLINQVKELKMINIELENENKLFKDNLYMDIKIHNDLPV